MFVLLLHCHFIFYGLKAANHGILEKFELERSLKIHLVPAPTVGRDTSHHPNLTWDNSRDGVATAFLGDLRQVIN